MAQVTVNINGRAYPVACEAGQEARIIDLARYVDGKVKTFAHDVGPVGEARLLLLAALVLADEMSEAKDAAARPMSSSNGVAPDESRLAVSIENLAIRVEAIAAGLETSHI